MVKSALPAITALTAPDADDGAVADLEAFLPVEAGVLGDERRAEGERRCRQRHQDVDLLAHDRSGTKPDCDADGGSDDAVWHRVLLQKLAATLDAWPRSVIAGLDQA